MKTERDTDWFALPDPGAGRDEPGLRFSCTQCGNCCSGPPGYVLVSGEEATALAGRMGVSVDEFVQTHTHVTREGRSLIERDGPHGFDCVFLDRKTLPGRAICSVYEDRPKQCRTWPFWPSVVGSKSKWERAKFVNGGVCPGIGKGTLYTPVQVRVQRDAFKI